MIIIRFSGTGGRAECGILLCACLAARIGALNFRDGRGNSRSRLGGAFSGDLLTEEEVLSVYEIYFKMKPRCRME